MSESKSKISLFGIGVGAIALLLALVHFWSGPFTEKPPLEQKVAEKVVAIKDATLAALKGEEFQAKPQPSGYDLDQILSIATALLGGIAMILGVVAYAQKEPMRAAGGAALLGGAAIAFQFLALALGAIILVLLISAVLGSLGIG